MNIKAKSKIYNIYILKLINNYNIIIIKKKNQKEKQTFKMKKPEKFLMILISPNKGIHLLLLFNI